MDDTSARPPRRSPDPEDRVRDAERSRRRLLEAALDEFSAKGFAGARVQEIADRAGVNKQLITYYFGGKEGLYRELRHTWLRREADAARPDLPLEELAVRHLHDALADPRMLRLGLWRGLTDAPDPDDPPQASRPPGPGAARHELAEGLDPDSVMLFLIGAVTAPVTMPHVVRRVLGTDPSAPGFEEHYAEQLRRIIRRLTA